MDNQNYKLLLLKVAVCSIGADNVIDDREVDMLKKIEKKSSYFSNIDLEKMLNDEISKFEKNSHDYQEKVFNEIQNNNFLVPQELCFLEVAILIIKADGIEEEIEKLFVKKLRSYLSVDDYIVKERFRDVDYFDESFDLKFKDFNNTEKGEK